MLTDTRRLPQAKRPIRVKAGPKAFYFVFGAENAREIFVANTKNLTLKSQAVEAFRGIGMPADDLDIVIGDESGTDAKPKPGHEIDKDKRIYYNTYQTFAHHLMAPTAVRAIAEKFQEQMAKQLALFTEKDFVSVSLFKFLRREMVIASGTAFHGELLFRLFPEWHEILWGFDEA